MVEKFMAWFTKHSNKGKAWQAYAEILRHGLILAGFNIALALVYLLGFAVLSILFDSLEFDGLFSAYISMSAIFAFAAAGAIVWYRYGRILGSSFKQRKIINSSLVVLISILPILVFMILFSGIFDLAGGFGNEFMAIAFLVIILLAVLSAVFEFLIVSLGVMTPNK